MGEKLVCLGRKVSQLIERDAVKIYVETLQTNIIGETMERTDSPFESDSPQNLLWEQQNLQNSMSSKKRWHPLIILWCLSIYLKSPGTCKNIRKSPFLFLPCKNTLLKYINFTEPGCVFLDSIKG